ncbi:hypothetical protein ACFW16_32635 [Inquilinus sp. NPDC058860]|uniref:hypothetical protein n=1 Tax=Inquilinus sp. NPDC058860 TaxID=3346652 RepID=UPI0036CAF6D7
MFWKKRRADATQTANDIWNGWTPDLIGRVTKFKHFEVTLRSFLVTHSFIPEDLAMADRSAIAEQEDYEAMPLLFREPPSRRRQEYRDLTVEGDGLVLRPSVACSLAVYQDRFERVIERQTAGEVVLDARDLGETKGDENHAFTTPVLAISLSDPDGSVADALRCAMHAHRGMPSEPTFKVILREPLGATADTIRDDQRSRRAAIERLIVWEHWSIK